MIWCYHIIVFFIFTMFIWRCFFWYHYIVIVIVTIIIIYYHCVLCFLFNVFQNIAASGSCLLFTYEEIQTWLSSSSSAKTPAVSSYFFPNGESTMWGICRDFVLVPWANPCIETCKTRVHTKTFQGATFWNPYRVFFKGLRFDTP